MVDDSAWVSKGVGTGGGLTILPLARTRIRFMPAVLHLVHPILPSLSDLQLTGSVPSACHWRVVIKESFPEQGRTVGMALLLWRALLSSILSAVLVL
jgi:3-polyprenyl-4-hydroxybenzoate decarboxylase